LRIFDIRAIAARAKAAGAKVGVDNTFLSPALQRPTVLGADFVIGGLARSSTQGPTLSSRTAVKTEARRIRIAGAQRRRWRAYRASKPSRLAIGADPNQKQRTCT
jgi:hypothetical protein